MDFDEIAAERLHVKELCREHVPSVLTFKFQKGASFTVLRPAPQDSGEEVRHLTTTATCIESLQDCHPTFWPADALPEFGRSRDDVLHNLKQAFYLSALKRKEWVSEDSAPIYCACRALPLFLRSDNGWSPKHAELIPRIYQQLKEPQRFGIGEETKKPKPPDPKWYPENAYHTYWALVVLQRCEGPLRTQAQQALRLDLDHLKERMLLWARAKLAEEVALHWAKSAALDSDQLTWALTTFIDFEPDLSSSLRSQDIVRKAFEALRSTQEPIGTWRHYRPLFVYSNVGNAYCYVYESFTYLLKALLRKFEQEEFLEGVARQFIDSLRRLTEYTEMTQVRDRTLPNVTAWSSGHRPASPAPEGWATASVFSFLQAYRRLLGILARRDAARMLPRPTLLKAADPISDLAARGDTWLPRDRKTSVAEDLITLFVNPVRKAPMPEPSEPDDKLIGHEQARSAILFGPPGASKTTLARYVAAALGWDYVELHSSHFVKEGIQAVQSTADRIFAQLKELDRAVVLFDEPDELVREREGMPDAFGRFLTTSMLPRVAELWKQGRIIYFVATNHIRYFDAAIIRSERFDVLIFVPPPSFKKKTDELCERIELYGRQPQITVTQTQIETALTTLDDMRWGTPSPEAELPAEQQLAKFILLRWDQIDELACQLTSSASGEGVLEVDASRLSTALQQIKDRRLSRLQTYLEYLDDLQYARRDFQRKPVYSVRDLPEDADPSPWVERTESGVWLTCPLGECPETLPGYKVLRTGKIGEVEIMPSEVTGNPRS